MDRFVIKGDENVEQQVIPIQLIINKNDHLKHVKTNFDEIGGLQVENNQII